MESIGTKDTVNVTGTAEDATTHSSDATTARTAADAANVIKSGTSSTHMLYVDGSPVPVIDFGPFVSGDESSKKTVVEAIRTACENIGFMVVCNTNVDKKVINECWNVTRAFFDQPTSDKQKWTSPDEAEYPFGYVGFGEETLSYGKDEEDSRTAGEGKQRTAVAPDLKENFSMGPYNPASGLPAPRLPETPGGFREAWMNYYKAMEKLATDMLRAFALSLNLPENWFEDKIDRHRCALRALNYPDLEEPPKPGQLRASAHTDYGTLTILLPDDAPGGLQVRSKDGQWLPVPHIPGAFVINLGDLMRRWTNDRWESTLHRVVPPPMDTGRSCRRQSIAFFHNINADHVVHAIPTCVDEEHPAKYPPITAGEHLLQKHLASLGKSQTNK